MQVSERVDPRCTRSQQKVLAAAVAVLREEGLPGLTYEAVAARSGVARSTIYRHYPDRAALHVAAVSSVGPSMTMPHSDDVVADVSAFLRELNHMLAHSDFGAVLLTALDAAERSDVLARMTRDASSPRRSMLTGRLRDAQRDGVLDAGADLDMVGAQLVGAVFHYRFISRRPLTAHAVAALVAATLTPLLLPAARAVPPPCATRPADPRRSR